MPIPLKNEKIQKQMKRNQVKKRMIIRCIFTKDTNKF